MSAETATEEPEEPRSNPYENPSPTPVQVLNMNTARYLLEKYHFKTYRDTGEVLVYKDGYYQKGGDQLIEREAQRMNGAIATKHNRAEIISHIRVYTYTPREDFDKDKHFINVKNGIYNLLTGEFQRHNPKILSTVQLPIVYNPNQDCPNIKKYMSEVVSPEDTPILEEWAGYGLYKGYPYAKALMMYGQPGTGKGVFISLLKAFLGEGNYSAVPLQNIGDRFQAASLYGKLANLCGDLSDREVNDIGTFKKATGGDPINAEHKGQNPFTFVNYAKLTFSANKIPRIYGAREELEAFFERWLLVPFKNKFRFTGNDDPYLIDKLTTPDELSGFFNLATNGFRRLYRNKKFSHSRSTEEVRLQYIKLSDPVKSFANDMLKSDPYNKISEKDMYIAYIKYCDANNVEPIPSDQFKDDLTRAGYSCERTYFNSVRDRYWKYVSIVGG